MHEPKRIAPTGQPALSLFKKTVVMGKPGLISGAICNLRGKPVADARVYVTDGPVPLPDIAALTDADGRFALSVPAAGSYTFECSAEGFAPKRVTLNVVSGQQAQLDFQLRS